MFESPSSQVERRLTSLERHLKLENPVLLQVVQGFRDLDKIAYRMGILDRSESFATRVPWWPLISVLGTFSSGKSTFINSYLEHKIQRTGNQAVDDKFTVMCYSKEESVRTLPGLALDADPRFPFYQISREIEHVTKGEGRRIDAYLQLKTCLSDKLNGKILIDSPGFDADAQRNATLRITDHIMDLSDLVLVFFDARHPEPGAMKDTLDHLVKNTISRSDSNKFLFVLNQVDCTVNEDNLEDVVAAWQRALSQSGLTAGHFFQIYNLEAAPEIENETMRNRYESKRAEDMAAIEERIRRVEVERAYRIIGVVESTAKLIQDETVPRLTALLQEWRKKVLVGDIIILALFGLLGLMGVKQGGVDLMALLNQALWRSGSFLESITADLIGVTTLAVFGYAHVLVRKLSLNSILKRLPKEIENEELLDFVTRGMRRNTRLSRALLATATGPAGWGRLARARLLTVLKKTDAFVQNLNDQFTNPSGRKDAPNPSLQLDAG